MNYIISEQLGSNSVITDEDGNEVMRYKYSPFGNLIRSQGNTEDSYRFTGKEFDGMTGLYYYGARYYDPTIGRFITEDPIQDGWNWFVYCENNPLKYVDPDGLEIVTANVLIFLGGGTAGAGGYMMSLVDYESGLDFSFNKEQFSWRKLGVSFVAGGTGAFTGLLGNMGISMGQTYLFNLIDGKETTKSDLALSGGLGSIAYMAGGSYNKGTLSKDYVDGYFGLFAKPTDEFVKIAQKAFRDRAARHFMAETGRSYMINGTIGITPNLIPSGQDYNYEFNYEFNYQPSYNYELNYELNYDSLE